MRIGEDMLFRSVVHSTTVAPAAAAVFDGPETASLVATRVVKLAELVLSVFGSAISAP